MNPVILLRIIDVTTAVVLLIVLIGVGFIMGRLYEKIKRSAIS